VKEGNGNKSQILAVACALLLVILVMAGCGGKADSTDSKASPTASPGASPAASPTSKTTNKTTATKSAATTKASAAGSSKTTPTATPKAMPKLTDIAFTLTLPDGQDYTENTIPIYLKADQTIHMNWLVVKGGNHFHMTFSLPDGNIIAVGNTGNLTAYGRGETTCEDLTKNRDLVFRPGDNDWQDGYYLFHPQLQTGDQPVTVKILYWIE
jgi:hypothetical protein